jgi:ribosome-associated protein
MKKQKNTLGGMELVKRATELALEKKAENIVTIQLPADSGIADYFVVCETDNSQHTRAIADWIVGSLKEEQCAPWHVEGTEEGTWVLIDYSDVVVHVMLTETREFYKIEKLWGTVVATEGK